MKILVIEENILLANSIKNLLESNGFYTDLIYDGTEGQEYALLGIYDLLIINAILPSINGYQLIQNIRSQNITIPILMIKSNASIDDKIKGLTIGADYYLTEPFDKREFLACIHALLRRYGSQAKELCFGNTSLNLDKGMLICNTKNIRLSAKEFEIIRLLFQTPEKNLSKEFILTYVWGYDSNAVENHVEVYIGFLRKKLATIDSNIRIIAIRKLGYHLELFTKENKL